MQAGSGILQRVLLADTAVQRQEPAGKDQQREGERGGEEGEDGSEEEVRLQQEKQEEGGGS